MTTAVPAHPAESGTRPAQPWRAALAVAEAGLAAAVAVLSVWCWHRGIATIVTPAGDGHPPLVSTVLYGDWAASAIGLCALGALLVVDAVWQAVRWVRSRVRPRTAG